MSSKDNADRARETADKLRRLAEERQKIAADEKIQRLADAVRAAEAQRAEELRNE